MRALIVGAGAIGQYLAARLSLAGHDAVLFARPDAAQRLASGYTLATGTSSRRVQVPAATTPADAALSEPFELAITAVKSFSTSGAIDAIRSIPACEHATILTVQNGLGSEELCAQAFGDDRVVAGSLTTAVVKSDQGVSASRSGGLCVAPVGSLPHNWIIAAFETTGVRVAAVADWRALKWSKLCINIQANAVCAVLDWTPEQVYADATAFSIERRCLQEALATMDRLHLAPVNLIDFPVPLLAAAVRRLPPGVLRLVLASRVAKARGGKLPSLLLDTRAHKRRLEVDALNGAVAARAQAAGASAPANATVARILDGIAAGTVDREQFHGKPDALASAISEAK